MAEDPTMRHGPLLEALRAAVLESPGRLDPEVRHAAAVRGEVPEPFAGYVRMIHDHAYRITDRVLADMRAAGASEDEVFEVTVASAYGAARHRLDAGLTAVRTALEGR
jgi:hypothetical protein